MKRETLIGALFTTLLATGAAFAADPADTKQLNAQATQMDSLATSKGNVKVESRISSDFSAFAGSTANSSSLVSGLRNGTPITLTSTDAKGALTETTFTPSTGKMGYGNVFISLGLAQQQLTGLGITQPTTQDIRAALIGGDVTVNGQTTALKGVLTYRSQGMGWGQIANTLGFKLGPVISGMKSANARVSAPTAAAASASTSGVTNAAGSNPGQGNAHGRGITTGAGGAAGQGGGNAYGRGITSGAGGAPGPSGAAGSQARGAGKGG